MGKSNGGGGAHHNLLWCFLLIFISFLVLYYNYGFISSKKNVVQLSKNSYADSIRQNHVHLDTQSHVIGGESIKNTSSLSYRSEAIYASDISVNGSVTQPASYRSEAIYASDLPGNRTAIQQVVETESHLPAEAGLQNKGNIMLSDDPCLGKYVYIHNLPSKYNVDILKDCKHLSFVSDMCMYLSNDGLGPKIEDPEDVFPKKGWYNTNQFVLSVVFHNRMKQYKCLTENSTKASAIYVPYYAGLDVGRYLWGYNTSVRDSLSNDLVTWLTKTPEWKVMGGRDHFVTLGRIAWDFVREQTNGHGWGNNFMVRPEGRNMSMFTIESSPWHSNSFAIPYPTYFHPSNDKKISEWQERMRRYKKHHLFSFAGAPRPEKFGSIRGLVIDQCAASKRSCKLLDCTNSETICHTPSTLLKLFQDSVFCLQPEGDSYTRRSSFDSILAGCIPVFFHEESAYAQYKWHLPEEHTEYSVFIPANAVKNGSVSIEETLRNISRKKVRTMRRNVINLIPKVVYADPKSRLDTVEDAFDISVKRIIQRVNDMKRNQQG